MKLNCPHCNTVFDVDGDLSTNEVKCPSCFTIVSMIELLTVSISPKGDQDGRIDDEDEFVPGDTLRHFQLIRQLGRGGFGLVFEAHDRRLDRNVALKVPRASQLSERQAHVFIREARAAARLKVANIVSVFEVGRVGNRIFIVSELIDGTTLGQWARKVKPDQYAAAGLISKLARAIHQAHDAGIIHRDLKPNNVLVDKKNEAHITDFGLAKRFDDDEEPVSGSESVMGTPAYMSPEQASGRSETADCRSDVYSLGVMLYELLTTSLPFAHSDESNIYDNIKTGRFPSPRQQNARVHADVEAVCLKAMALAPEDRYASASEFADDLDRFQDHRSVKARPVGWVQQSTYLLKRHRIAVAAVAVILLLIALNISNRPPNPSPEVKSIALPLPSLDVEFEVKPDDAKVSIFQVDMNLGRVDFSVAKEPGKLGQPGLRRIRLEPGTYLIQTESSFGVHQVYRIVPGSTNERVNRDYRITEWNKKDDDSDSVVLRPIEAKPAIEVEPGIYALGPEKLVLMEPGEFETGNDSAKRINKQGRIELRVPKKLVSMPSYLLGQTEVTAQNFHAVMGRFPREMPINGDPLPTDVATNVSWIEAIEYCERIGARLPTYDEYLFAATNRGSTKFPFGDQFILTEWKIGSIKQPANDKTQTQPSIYNLYSSVGEWAWDINLSTDSRPIPQQPDSRLLAMYDGRMLLGIPPGAPEKLALMTGDEPQFGPADFVDQSLHQVKRTNGFRVGKRLGLPLQSGN